MTDIYDESVPPDSQKVKLGAQRLRELTANVEDTLEVEHIVVDTDEGMHKKVTLGNADAPVLEIADKIIAYGDDVDSIAELHSMDENGDIIQYSSQGNLCITNTKQPAAGEADKILIYAEDRDSKIKLRAMDEDDNVIPIEGFATDSDLDEQTYSGTSWALEPNLGVTLTVTAGEVYECMILGIFKMSHKFAAGSVTIGDTSGRGSWYAVAPTSSDLAPQPGYRVENDSYYGISIGAYFKVTNSGSTIIRQKWKATSSYEIYCNNRHIYVRRVK